MCHLCAKACDQGSDDHIGASYKELVPRLPEPDLTELNVNTNHLPPMRSRFRRSGGGAWDMVFLTSSQVMLVLSADHTFSSKLDYKS